MGVIGVWGVGAWIKFPCSIIYYYRSTLHSYFFYLKRFFWISSLAEKSRKNGKILCSYCFEITIRAPIFSKTHMSGNLLLYVLCNACKSKIGPWQNRRTELLLDTGPNSIWVRDRIPFGSRTWLSPITSDSITVTIFLLLLEKCICFLKCRDPLGDTHEKNHAYLGGEGEHISGVWMMLSRLFQAVTQ